MRGPIDYIIVGFEGNKFDGSILRALSEAIDRGIIALVALTVIKKDDQGDVSMLDIGAQEDQYIAEFTRMYKPDNTKISSDDIAEVADLVENKTSVGLLIIEQLWAIPLKKALVDANGVLVAEGRIHPDAAAELNEEEGK